MRNVTATLGCSLADRLRCSGLWAYRGLPRYWDTSSAHHHHHRHHKQHRGSSGSGIISSSDGAAAPGNSGCCCCLQGQQQPMSDADRRFAQASYRLNLRGRILLIQGYVTASQVVNRVLLATLAAFGQPVVMF